MPRIIFKCRYLKNASEHLVNMVEYIATREGVEKMPDTTRLLSATKNQQRLIAEIMDRFPDTADLFEYEDYIKEPTRGNASEFITMALEQNPDLIGKRENYVDYIANRPGAERLGSHGLFTDTGVPVVLSKVAEAVGSHTGNVWTNILSLRREDAVRLGYDNAKAWQDLIRSQRNVIAESMKIVPENLRWYAAYHDEGHHPHIHLIAYSINPTEAYVTKEAIQNMRSSLAREIFKQDLLQIYTEQTNRRNTLNRQGRDAMKEILGRISNETCENKTIEGLISHLAERLTHISGKKQYGYLKAPLKAVIDQIVDELAKDARIAEAYAKWYELRNEVLLTYTGKLPPPLPLSQQKEFKSIKNMVIAEAMNIGNHHFTIESDGETEAAEENANSLGELDDEPHTEEIFPTEEAPADSEEDQPYAGADAEATGEDKPKDNERPYIAWSDRYKDARMFLYGTDETELDFGEAFWLFLEEAESGNVLAMHDLGRMYADGLGVEMDADTSFTWYEKALFAFQDIEAEKENRYVEYRIGKMHMAGLGTAQDYDEAAGWFNMAVSRNHKYAQYSLAGLYYRGRGVEQSFETAFELYRRAARQHMPYAHYELAQMYRDGIGTTKNNEEAELHFEEAFYGFQRLEEQSRDDKLQYRLGQMLYTGTGTAKDIPEAIKYFENAARLGNVHAQYMLGKLYLDAGSEHENVEKALQWLAKAADSGNAPAQYALGKLYRDGRHVEKDIQKAIALFARSAEQDNHYASYALGKLYLSETDIPRNVPEAVKWFTHSADLGNQFAQYALAKLYLSGEDVPKDVPRAVELLVKAALQSNQFAQYRLGRLYLSGENVPKDISAAVKWLTASAEQGNQYAQYTLGKLYLMGHDLPRDREAALKWLTASAAQGNVYASFFLDRMDDFRDPSVLLAATRLMHHLGNIIREQYGGTGGNYPQVDRKLRRKLEQKKRAQGHAYDDHALQLGN